MLKIMEKMNNKTCGECKHYDKTVTCNDYAKCSCKEQLVYRFVSPKQQNCKHFEPKHKPTNGDRTRAMSDEELAEKFIYTRREQNGDKCYLSTITVGKWSTIAEAIAATIKELKKEFNNGQI